MNSVFSKLSSGGAFPGLGWDPFDTTRLSSFGEWQDFVRNNFPWLEYRDKSGGGFEAEVSSQKFDYSKDCAIELSTISASAGEVVRTRQLAEMSENGFIKILWQLGGGVRVEQGNQSCAIVPGQVSVCDTARPYRIEMSDRSQFAVLTLPHQACPGWEQIGGVICGTKLSKSASISAALGSLMALTSASQLEPDDDIKTVVMAVQLMITKALHQSAAALGLSRFKNPLLYKVQRHIVANIPNPEFSTDDLAAEMCMSRRSLYMLFEGCGTTPARLIRDTRLELAMRILADRTQKNRKITDIVFEIGFNDYATFSRIFKAQFGKTPSEFRIAADVEEQGFVH